MKNNDTITSTDGEDEEAPFEANLINSTVYIVSMTLQVSTFAVNYRVSIYFIIYDYSTFLIN